MREWLAIVSEPASALIDAIALLVILMGTVEVLFTVARAAFKPLGEQLARRAWLRYSRWLVAGLTFQLAADIIDTSITTSWQTIGRVAGGSDPHFFELFPGARRGASTAGMRSRTAAAPVQARRPLSYFTV